MRFPAFLALAASCLVAQTKLTLRQAVDRALESHPLLPPAEQRTLVASGLREQAALSPNPRLILQSENTRPYGNPSFSYLRDTDNFAYLQNTFETAGRRARRVDVADASVRRLELERELLRRQIAARVGNAYWSAAGAARVRDLLLEDGKTMQGVVDYHAARVREGAMAEADLIRVRLEAQRLLVSANLAKLDAERSRIHLQREMGQTEFEPLELTDPIDQDQPPPTATIADALAARPEIKVARAAVEHAQANQRLQLAVAKPNVDVVFGYKRTAGLDTMLGGVQMDLPFANRNQGNIAAAGAEIRLAQTNLAATEALIKAEVAAAEADYRIRRRDVLETLKPTLDQASETYRIADAAYRAGGSDLLRLLDAQRLRTESQIALARSLAELRQSEVALRVALGGEP
jgi:outer membrane protein TolC